MSKKQVYFIGIGGIGMSALARYYLAQNWAVSGSDATDSVITQELRKQGLRVKIGPKKAGFSSKTVLIIRSQAVSEDNLEVRAARTLSIPVLTYPEAVGQITKKHRTIAIAGAHGKSTTTGLLTDVFLKAKKNPTVIIGTKLKSLFGKNFRIGKSRWLILEADEFGGAFWHYSPVAALINNIDKEHLDFYKNLAGVKKSFLRFIGNISANGLLILNKDDKNLFSLKNQIEKIINHKKIKVIWYSLSANPLLTEKIKSNLSIPGRHNLSNALGAYWLAKNLGLSEKNIFAGLKNYPGAWRRFEYRGKMQIANSRVFDDYAHHPNEIKATLAGAKEKFPDSKIICVFQPHQRERLKLLFQDFTKAFQDADTLILLPAYQVAGRDRQNSNYDSRALAKAIKGKNPQKKVYFLPSSANLKKTIIKNLKLKNRNYIVIMMGAGNISDFTNSLLK